MAPTVVPAMPAVVNAEVKADNATAKAYAKADISIVDATAKADKVKVAVEGRHGQRCYRLNGGGGRWQGLRNSCRQQIGGWRSPEKVDRPGLSIIRFSGSCMNLDAARRIDGFCIGSPTIACKRHRLFTNCDGMGSKCSLSPGNSGQVWPGCASSISACSAVGDHDAVTDSNVGC